MWSPHCTAAPAMMKANRTSALVALLLAFLGGAAVAGPGARPAKTRAMGTYKGTVTVKSSAAIPGLVPRERKSVMTLSMTRRGNQVELEIHDPDGLGPGRPLTSKDKGRICCVKRAPRTAIVDLEFDGPEFVDAVEERVNAGMSHLAVAKGMKVELSNAQSKAKVSLKGDQVTFHSTAIVVRKPVRGLRGRLLEAVTPNEMTLEFSGELTRQPANSARHR